MSQDYESMFHLSKECRDTCERVGIRYFGSICCMFRTWAQAWRSNPADYIDEFRRGLAAYEEMRCGLQLGLFHVMQAQLLLAAGRAAEAAKEAEIALVKVGVNDELWWAPEIHRTLGDALLALPVPDEVEAENCFRRAVAEARRAGALMLELRAAVSVAQILARRGDAAAAQRMVDPVLDDKLQPAP
jgi:predicted ATPase